MGSKQVKVKNPVPKSLNKRGINSVEDNVGDDQYVNCGSIIFACFKEELCEKFLIGGDASNER